MKKFTLAIYILISFTIHAKNHENITFVEKALSSKSMNKHIVAGLLVKSYDLPFSTEQIYRSAIKMDANNFLLVHQLFHFCGIKEKTSICNKNKHLKKLIKLDPDNALINLYASIYYDEIGKTNKALKHMQIGGSKNKFKEYGWQYLHLTREELVKTNYPSQMILEVSLKNAHISDFINNTLIKGLSLCKEKSRQSHAWKNACLNFAQVMELHSQMIVSTFVGFAIQREILSINKADIVEFENVKHRREVFHQFRLKVVNHSKWASLVGFENEVPESFWKELLIYGERIAHQRILNQISQSSENNSQ